MTKTVNVNCIPLHKVKKGLHVCWRADQRWGPACNGCSFS